MSKKKTYPRGELWTKMSYVIVILLLIILFPLVLGFILEYMEGPTKYFTFPLDDRKGKYIINYDGDYWLTYYTPIQKCSEPTDGTMPVCEITWRKDGNTSIMETPVDLVQFVDKEVSISGEFKPTYGSIDGEDKQYCVINEEGKKCEVSKGPGIWYSSPLQIKTIELAQ